MELDRKSSDIVLASIRSAVPNRWSQKADELRSLSAGGNTPSLRSFLNETGLDLDDVMTGTRGWSDLCEAAGLPTLESGPNEATLRRGAGRLTHIDDPFRLSAYRALVGASDAPVVGELSTTEQRVARMLISQVVDQTPRSDLAKDASLQDGLNHLWAHPQVRAELLDLFDVLEGRTSHLQQDLPGRPTVPLRIHARYSRLEILAAFGEGDGARVPAWQTGCRWLPDANADVFAFTLDKTGGSFSPTTRYRDYAISQDLIHWESQTVTRAASGTGMRYQDHETLGSDIILFARVHQHERAFWCLGPARYVRHERERPMAITWRLQTPLPGDLFAQFAAAVA